MANSYAVARIIPLIIHKVTASTSTATNTTAKVTFPKNYLKEELKTPASPSRGRS